VQFRAVRACSLVEVRRAVRGGSSVQFWDILGRSGVQFGEVRACLLKMEIIGHIIGFRFLVFGVVIFLLFFVEEEDEERVDKAIHNK
jgi:hypothetical protein